MSPEKPYKNSLSHSAVEDYISCGEKFRLRRIINVPRVPSWALLGGLAVHETTANLDLVDMGVVSDDAPETFELNFDLFISETENVSEIPRANWKASGRVSRDWPCKENEDWWRFFGPQMVSSWRNFLKNSPWQVWITPEGIPAIELELEWDIGDIRVKGYLDRVLENTITGDLAVVDLKSGSREPKPSQLYTYGHGLKARYGADAPRYGFYFMTRTGETSIPVDLRQADDGRLEYIYTNVRRQIDSQVFIPNVSHNCGFCDVRDFCFASGGREAATIEKPFPEKKETK